LHFDEDLRIGDPVIVAKGPYVIWAHGESDHLNKSVHGYDPTHFPNMPGIFYAAGPDLRQQARLEPFAKTSTSTINCQNSRFEHQQDRWFNRDAKDILSLKTIKLLACHDGALQECSVKSLPGA
jgi:hypothetical protein